MSKICFDTDNEAFEINEALEDSLMVLKLKGDSDTPLQKGMRRAFEALARCKMILNILQAQPSPNAHDIERFSTLMITAQKQVGRYKSEFNLSVIHEVTKESPKPITPPITSPAIKRRSDYGQPQKYKLTDLDVKKIKQLLTDMDKTIVYADCVDIQQAYYPDVSAATIAAIAQETTWSHIPWPAKSAPKYLSVPRTGRSNGR